MTRTPRGQRGGRLNDCSRISMVQFSDEPLDGKCTPGGEEGFRPTRVRGPQRIPYKRRTFGDYRVPDVFPSHGGENDKTRTLPKRTTSVPHTITQCVP